MASFTTKTRKKNKANLKNNQRKMTITCQVNTETPDKSKKTLQIKAGKRVIRKYSISYRMYKGRFLRKPLKGPIVGYKPTQIPKPKGSPDDNDNN